MQEFLKTIDFKLGCGRTQMNVTEHYLHALVRVLFATEEDEVLERVRTAVIAQRFGGDGCEGAELHR
jgi:hypothetical protein